MMTVVAVVRRGEISMKIEHLSGRDLSTAFTHWRSLTPVEMTPMKSSNPLPFRLESDTNQQSDGYRQLADQARSAMIRDRVSSSCAGSLPGINMTSNSSISVSRTSFNRCCTVSGVPLTTR
jgi:hypothetical protein